MSTPSNKKVETQNLQGGKGKVYTLGPEHLANPSG